MDEPLRKAKDYLSKQTGDNTSQTDAARIFYVLLCILEKLENIESDLSSMSSDNK